MIKYAIGLSLALLSCDSIPDTVSDPPSTQELRTPHHYITYVREPTAGLCFAYIEHVYSGMHYSHAGIALAHVPCTAFPDLELLPVISADQYVTVIQSK